LDVPAGGWMPFRDRDAWLLAATKLLTDQAWWFMLFWLPDYLHRRFALDMRHLGAPVATIYAMAAVGAPAGGILPRLIVITTGIPYARARSAAMATFAVMIIPIASIAWVHGLWPTVLLAGFALACHQGFSTNVFALSADMFPAARIGTAIGFAAFFGNVGGALTALLAGWLLQHEGTVTPMFFLAAGGYGAAWMLLRTSGALRPRVPA